MNGWRESTLGEEIELAYGKALAAHTREAGDFNVFGSNGIVGTHAVACVDGPGIVIGRKGSVGEIRYSKAAFWPIDTTYYVVNKEEHDWRFLYHLLKHADLTTLNSHSAVPGLNREDAYSVAVRLPPRAVEPDISKALDFLERTLLLEDRAIENAKALKAASMGELFSRGLRGEVQKETEISSVPQSWDVVPFSTVREWLQYGTSTRCSTETASYAVLRIPNISSGAVIPDDLKYCDMPASEAAKYRLALGDLIFIRTNGVLERLGSCAVYRGAPQQALFASYLIRARLDLKRVEPRFVAHFYGSKLGTSLVAGRATPASDGKYNLNTGTIDALPLPVPPTLDEQVEIADILDAIDAKIALHQQKRAVLEELFKALLHKLMTGEIDVNDLDLSALQPAT
jgi:type I restriction enzyme, S subunit